MRLYSTTSATVIGLAVLMAIVHGARAAPMGGEVGELRLDGGAGTVLTWDALPGATGYDLLASRSPAFDGNQVFLQVGKDNDSATDDFVPSSTEIRHYLVRAVYETSYAPAAAAARMLALHWAGARVAPAPVGAP